MKFLLPLLRNNLLQLSHANQLRYADTKNRTKTITLYMLIAAILMGLLAYLIYSLKIIYSIAWSYEVGDILLRAVVTTIRSVIRSSDALIRYGGDEFFLVIPNISQEMFEQKLNEILYHIRMIQIPESKNLYLSPCAASHQR